MRHIEAIVIGGGQAGLAMSRSLSARDIEHVVLERGRVGERWRSERWDSLRLLTPRWLSRVAGWSDDDADPDGFMGRQEVVRYLDRFALACDVPLLTGVTVLEVRREDPGFRVDTDQGCWRADHVVVATGESQDARVPSMAANVHPSVHQVDPTRYRAPGGLPDGGVLVVGASATGIQLAAEIHASGRPVTLSVGRHTRLPRRYRGRDILAWFHDLGMLDERAGSVKNLAASRAQPSMQLTGNDDGSSLDLGVLVGRGVRLTGRALGVARSRVVFEDDLLENIAGADVKLARLRMGIDAHIRERGLAGEVGPEEPFVPVPLVEGPRSLNLAAEGIRTVVWATGFRKSYPWLKVPVLDGRGEIRHDGGVTPQPGLYVLGLNFLRRRSSSFLAGVGDDAEELANHLVARRRAVGASREVSVA